MTDETAYREVVRGLAVWCQDNNLFLNISKTKELETGGPSMPPFTSMWL
jgi:hypothetical protein